MDAASVRAAIVRLAESISDAHQCLERLLIVGIPTRGVEVARRIVAEIERRDHIRPDLGTLDISMHRDDLATRRQLTAMETTDLPLDIEGRTVILVDDVVFTGRSCRAALDAMLSFGRPARIEYGVLVDRGHRELPIAPNYVGRQLTTRREQRIRVRFDNLDGVEDSVRLVNP